MHKSLREWPLCVETNTVTSIPSLEGGEVIKFQPRKVTEPHNDEYFKKLVLKRTEYLEK